jgi:hypothetical protein
LEIHQLALGSKNTDTILRSSSPARNALTQLLAIITGRHSFTGRYRIGIAAFNNLMH